MHAMQYSVTLPADYDMEIIRHRVKTRGHLLDDFDGLGLKAYGIRERGRDGSPVNEYAPFYLWAQQEAMNRFLFGEGFRGVVRDFGRPAVHNWQGLYHRPGPAADHVPASFTRHAVPVPEGTDVATVIEDALAVHEKLATTDGVHTTALGLDPRRWELLHFTLWADAAPESVAGERFQVLHLSTPGVGRLGAGRQW
ncbi:MULTISPECIES: DUF4865 family protein [unclassified Streptomyces]|uniref:DUF4865 family protein n=1 Tax=unclassified Streptomyces TaxID=2593676 RepID=UPI000378EFDE|nr:MULTISPECIES: DUF4865 family protein [unclassified Streptomyces]MYT28795.1 DUF4865 family protein [Streptomyces sp. SID8354]